MIVVVAAVRMAVMSANMPGIAPMIVAYGKAHMSVHSFAAGCERPNRPTTVWNSERVPAFGTNSLNR